MAREGALEDPAVPPDVGDPQKHLPCPRKAPDVVGEGPDPDAGDPKTPKVAQNTLEALDVAAETPNPDVLWARNGHRTLLVDSDTDVEEEGPNPDVGPQNRLKMTQNVPETPDVGLKTANPDVSWLKNECGTLVVESDTDVEEADSDVESPERLKMTQNIPETPDVAAKTPNPHVSGPKIRRGMELVDSDTDVEEDPDAQPQKRLKVTQNLPGIPDVETPNPAVERPKMGHSMLLVESDTDEEGEEENPDVEPQTGLRMTQKVPETPDVAAKAPNPDVSGPKARHWMLLGDSDTDVEDEVNPDVQPPKRLRVTQSVLGILDVEVETPNPVVERPEIRHQMLVVDSDTDMEEDPDMEPPKQLRVTQNVPESPDVAADTPSPDVSGPEVGCQTFLVDSDTDVEEENPDVEALRKLKMTPNMPESSAVQLQTPNPDVRRTENGCQALLEDSETHVEEEEASPDLQPSKTWKMTQNVPKAPDVPRQTPNPAVEGSQRGHRVLLEDSDTDVEEEVNPDVGSLKRPETAPNVPETPDVRPKLPDPEVSGTKVGCGMLLVGSDTDVEEDETSADVWPSKGTKKTQNMPETPDVPRQMPNPAVEEPWRGHGALLEHSDTDVDEADPDVRPSKRQKITHNVPETPDVGPKPPNPDVGRLQATQNSAKIPDVEEEEDEWDPDVATQIFLPPDTDVGEAEADPDIGSPKRLKTTQNPPEIPDVEEEEESDPDVATQLFLPSPVVGSPKTAPKAPKIPDVEGLPSLDPAVATQLFLPPGPDVDHHPNPDVLGSKEPQTAPDDPRIPDVRAATPDVEGEEDFDVATQLFLPPNTDVEGEGPLDPGVGSPQTPQTPINCLKIPDVEAETPKPGVEGPCPDPDVATQLFLPLNPDVEGEGLLDPDVWSSKSPQTPPKCPKILDVEVKTPNLDVEGLGQPRPDPDVATQLFLPPDPDVKHLESSRIAPNKPWIPDVEGERPNPNVGDASGPAQEDTEAPPTPQVRRSQRLAESRGGGASDGPAPTEDQRGQDPKPRPSPKPRPQKRRGRTGAGLNRATPSVSIKGGGRGSVSAPPPQREEPAGGAKRSLRPRAAPGPAPIRVLFTGLVASPALLVALGTLGGTEATSVRDCSHLVTDGIRRTLKFLCALGRGVPIVTPQWLLQSSHGGRPLSPDPFLPRDPSCERRFGFRLRPALARARARPLLQGYQVHVTPSVQPCPKDMRDIVTCCGGTFLPQLPREHAPRVLVISCPQDHSLWAPAVAARLPLLSAELLLSGVLRQRLDIAQFLLTPLEPPHAPLKTPDPPKKPQNPTQKPKNPTQKNPNPTQNASSPPQTLPPSPPRTRSGRRPPQTAPQKTPNSETPLKSPNPHPKRPQGHPEDPDPNFGVPDQPQEAPRTRSRRGPPQNPPRDPPNSGMPQKTPKRPPKNPNPPQKNPNPPQNAPKQPRGSLGGTNPNFGVLNSPPEPPRTQSGQRPPPNSGTPQKTPNQLPKAPKRPQNAANSTQTRPRGAPEGPHPKFEDSDPPPSPPRTRSRRGTPREPPKIP